MYHYQLSEFDRVCLINRGQSLNLEFVTMGMNLEANQSRVGHDVTIVGFIIMCLVRNPEVL